MLVTFFNLSLLSALVLPLCTLAAPHGSPSKRQDNVVDHADVQFTSYNVANGKDVSCGGRYSNDDAVVALSSENMKKELCNKRIQITYKDVKRFATIVDTCPKCPAWGLDLAQNFFTNFESKEGVIRGDWVFADASSSPLPSPPPQQSTPPPPPSPAAGGPPSPSPTLPAAASPSPSPSDSINPLCNDGDGDGDGEPSPTVISTSPPGILPSPSPSPSPSPQPSIPGVSPSPSGLRETSITPPTKTSTSSASIPTTAVPLLGSMKTSGAISVLAGTKEMTALVGTILFAFYCL